MSAVVQTDSLTKFYGPVQALKDVNLEVNQGEVFGYLGPNGAGKTTTIRTMLDLIRPTSGSASLFGLDSRTDSLQIRRRVGYLPGDITLYDKLTGWEALRYAAGLRGAVDWPFVDALAERLQCDLSLRIKALSRGNRQKVGLILAFMHRPELVVMDEPSSGLDPLIQQEFHRMVEEVRADGRTVFLSSHILPEVERVCDRVAIIRQGELIAVEDVASLKERALHRLEFHFASPVEQAQFDGLSGVQDLVVNDRTLLCTVVGTPDPLIKAVARFQVVKMISHEPNLEEIFLSYYGQGEQDAA